MAKFLLQAATVHCVPEPASQAALLAGLELLFLAYYLWSRPHSVLAVNILAVVVSVGQTAFYALAYLYLFGIVASKAAGAAMTLCALVVAGALIAFGLFVQARPPLPRWILLDPSKILFYSPPPFSCSFLFIPILARALYKAVREAIIVHGEDLYVWLVERRFGFRWWRMGRH
eukprot:tig00000581_g2221.t1